MKLSPSVQIWFLSDSEQLMHRKKYAGGKKKASLVSCSKV